jgi:hypothetical protein
MRDLMPLAADWRPNVVVPELNEAAGWKSAASCRPTSLRCPPQIRP